MQGWKQKLLSQVGREVMIKSVIQAIPSYAMQCYMLPKGFLDKLLVYIKRFFWSGDSHEQHIHWLNWDRVSRTKDQGGLGFRDLHCFNLALLAKQGWRLIMNPGSFWARVLKGIYFPHSSFLTASKGSRPSWLWQSLLQGRDLLLHGVRWQVGNGANISFWTHKWIPYSEEFYVRCPRGPFSENTLVSEFILDGHWNLAKLHSVVLPDEANFISKIPLSRTGSRDKIVWHYEAKGNYTVKSGYRLALHHRDSAFQNVASSSSSPDKSFWRQVWHLKTLPKIKKFWWRVCSNALATRENLFKRSCSSSPLCPICLSQVETIEHMLFECPWTKMVWFGSHICLRADSTNGSIVSRVRALLETVPSKSDRMKLHASIAVIAWQIWKSRNMFIFDHTPLVPFHTIQLCARVEHEFTSVSPMAANDSDSVAHQDESQTSSLKWIPPTTNIVKLNCDASFKFNHAAIGVIARDHLGSIIFCSGEAFPATSPLMAELCAIRDACRLVVDYGWQKAIVESDSKWAISLASTEVVPPWNLCCDRG